MPPLERVRAVPVPPLKTDRVEVPETSPPVPVTRTELARGCR